MTSAGLHHVTAICSDAATTAAFYGQLLGLPLVKRTVNYDDPNTWHLYFGDRTGTPGTLLTFFAWPDVAHGSPGIGEAVALALAIPKGAAHGWVRRLTDADIEVAIAPGADDAVTFRDPDGLALELVEQDWAEDLPGYETAEIDEAQAIRGIAGVTLLLEQCDATANLLEEVFGWHETARASNAGVLRLRYAAPGAPGPGRTIDLLQLDQAPAAEQGPGSIHHIAFRADNADAQALLAEGLRKAALSPGAVRDRTYFRSIYARDTSGLLIEIATDGPGFAVDEPASDLGRQLRLPAQFERLRAEIEAMLPPLD